MRFEGNSTVQFEQVAIVSTNKSMVNKNLFGVDVGVDAKLKKLFYGNFDSKWKDVGELELRSEDGFLRFVDQKKHRLVECSLPVGKRKKFESIIRKILHKQEKKLAKLQERNNPTPAATGRRQQRRTYGRNSKPLKRIIHRDNWLSEDEEDYRMDRVQDDPDDTNDNASDASEKDQDADSESEPEPEMEDEEPPTMQNDEGELADAVKDEDNFINDEVEEENIEEVDDEADKETTKTPKSRLQEGRRRLRKRVVDSFVDSDSDDDFGTGADMTTPMMQQRIVSPAEAGRTTDKAIKMDDSDTKAPPKGNIASFFNPRGTTKPKSPAKEVVAKTPAAKTPPRSKVSSTTPKRKSMASPLRTSQVPDWLTSPAIHPALSPARNATRDRLTSPPRTGKNEFQSKHTWSKFEEEDTAPKDEKLASPVALARSPKRSVLKRRKLVGNSYPRFGAKQSLSPNTQLFDKDNNGTTVEVNDDEPPCSFARGLNNMGNTCYLNSSLQMLYTVKDFVHKLEGKGADLVGSIVSTGHQLEDMTLQAPVSARLVKNAIDKQTNAFQGYSQRDAHECLGFLLDKIHDELSPPKVPDGDDRDTTKEEKKGAATEEDDATILKEQADAKVSVGKTPEDALLPTDEYFRCNIEVCLTCQSCGYSRTKQEMYRHLSLDIGGSEEGAKEENMQASVEKSLKLFFQPEEREIKCEKCDDGKTASQTLRLMSRPKALLLHLKRFVPGINIPFRKNKDPIALSKRLSMDGFLCDSVDEANAPTSAEKQYSLKSLVYHIGSTASSGHYTADALRTRPATPEEADEETHDEWVSLDDSKASVTKLSDVVASEQKKKTAYMLLYIME